MWHFYYEEWNLISFIKELIFDSDIKVKKQWPVFPGLKWHEFLNSLVYVRYLYTPSGPREITFLTFKEINRQNFSKMEQGLFPLPMSCLSTRLPIMKKQSFIKKETPCFRLCYEKNCQLFWIFTILIILKIQFLFSYVE